MKEIKSYQEILEVMKQQNKRGTLSDQRLAEYKEDYKRVSEELWMEHVRGSGINIYKDFPKEVYAISQDQAQLIVDTERFIHLNH